MRKLRRALDLLLTAGALLSTVGIVLVVVVQIIGRKFLSAAPPWTEEAARMCFVFAVAFAAPLAVRDRAYVAVDVFASRFARRHEQAIQGVIWLTVGGLMVAVAIVSVGFIRLGLGGTSPTLRVPMAPIHAAILLLAATTGLCALIEAVQHLRAYFTQGGRP